MNRARICTLSRSPRIDSLESIPGLLKSLQIRALDSLITLKKTYKYFKISETNLVTISDRVEVDIVVVVARILMQI
jgi:hypothetical protein